MTVVVNKDGGGSGGGSVLLSFILGAVLLAVAVVGFLMWDNYKSGGAPQGGRDHPTQVGVPMGDQVIIIDDEPKTKVVEKETVVVVPEIKTEKKETVTERTVVRETRE